MAAETCLQVRHHQNCSDPFARDVPNCNAQFAAGKFQKIVVIGAHFARWTALGALIQARDYGQFLRKELVLHFARNLKLAV